MKTIAVCFDTSPAGRRLLESAGRLAGEQEARLIGVCVGEPATPLTAHLQEAADALWQAGNRHTVTTELRVIAPADQAAAAAIHGPECDLLIVANPLLGVPAQWTLDHLLAQTGLPLLVVPDAWQGASIGWKITVLWHTGRLARRTVADALPLLTTAQSVDMLIAGGNVATNPEVRTSTTDMQAYLRSHGVHVSAIALDTPHAGLADHVLEHAMGSETDLIIFTPDTLAGPEHHRSGQLVRKMLDTEYLPLFVSC